jgi:hypothetical protein
MEIPMKTSRWVEIPPFVFPAIDFQNRWSEKILPLERSAWQAIGNGGSGSVRKKTH